MIDGNLMESLEEIKNNFILKTISIDSNWFHPVQTKHVKLLGKSRADLKKKTG